jgi:hypothetical protein
MTKVTPTLEAKAYKLGVKAFHKGIHDPMNDKGFWRIATGDADLLRAWLKGYNTAKAFPTLHTQRWR